MLADLPPLISSLSGNGDSTQIQSDLAHLPLYIVTIAASGDAFRDASI
jgi:hypothetical protein